MQRGPTNPRHAFTLVEVLIVVIILGILAAIVVPQFSDASHQSVRSTLQTTLDVLEDRIELARQKSPTGEYPSSIDSTWFASGIGPEHPENSFGVANVEVESAAGQSHPTNKVLKAGIGGAFWYNPAEGIVRARVADQGSSAATQAFYNEVNDSNEASLGNYSGGGGGGFGS
ncbi:MAG TPA: type II secretion system protein [Phycisphaerae bacterium]|nr:type II secretion system protein [Phycisphaerae bacterium]